MYDGGYGAEWGLAGGAIGATLLVKAYDWWTRRRRENADDNANLTLVNGLTERIQRLEERLVLIETDNTKLRSLLYEEQTRSARLGLRVISLEHEIHRLGGIPSVHYPEQAQE